MPGARRRGLKLMRSPAASWSSGTSVRVRVPMATRTRVPGQGFVGSSSASPSSPIVIISMNRAGHPFRGSSRRSSSSLNRNLSRDTCSAPMLRTPATGCQEKRDRAANAVGRGHPEGMDGVIARADIALRCADRSDLEYARLGEPVPVGITECSSVNIPGFVRVRVAGRYLELQEICNFQQASVVFDTARASLPRRT